MTMGLNFQSATAQGLADFKVRECAHRVAEEQTPSRSEAEERAHCEAEECDRYREAPTPETARSIK
jgi:hypothetical protein